MSKELVETIYGKYSKLDIYRESSDWGILSTKFYIYKDGKPWKGSYSTLSAAVAEAKKH